MDANPSAPPFKKPFEVQKKSNQASGFSLNLISALSEVKDYEEISAEEAPSVVDRRIKHHKVADEANKQLKLL